MPQISVIVPVYKVEDCLEFCVDSILNQTFTDFELILVDDGSPDNCGAMCDEYAKKDSRIRVIHRENGGLSAARNSGMDIMRGEYIAFIDSDDAVTEDYLDAMISAAGRFDADIVVCKFKEFEDGNIPDLKSAAEAAGEYKVFSGKEACKEVYEGSKQASINACCKLFRASAIENMRFPEGRLHEDQAFTPVAYYRSRKVVSIDRNIYLYRVRESSITHEKFNLKRYDDIWALDNCIRFFEENNEPGIVEAAKGRRERALCSYAVYAKRDKVDVPEEYRRSIVEALIYLRRNAPDDKYSYCLAQVAPGLLRAHEYVKRIEKAFKCGE